MIFLWYNICPIIRKEYEYDRKKNFNPNCSHCALLNDLNGTMYSRFIKLGVTADSLEGMYKKCHAAIRADPALKSAAKKDVTKKRWNAKKIGLAARKAKVAKAKAEFLSQIEAQKE